MNSNRRIGIIGGGKMGEAILDGILRSKIFEKERILISDVREEVREKIRVHHGVDTTENNASLAKQSDIVLLCVLPKDIPAVLESIKNSLGPDKLLVSIAAGVTTEYIQRVLAEKVDLIRVMPNNPCTIGEGVTVLVCAKGTPNSRLEEARELFANLGTTLDLEERLFNAVTGLSGSGPAYAYLFIEALANAGVKVGIPKQVAITLSAKTVLGAARMVLETKKHPAQLIDLVATPEGTTVQGLYELEESGLRASVVRAVEKATQRAKELSIP